MAALIFPTCLDLRRNFYSRTASWPLTVVVKPNNPGRQSDTFQKMDECISAYLFRAKAILNHLGLQGPVVDIPDRYLKIVTEMANNSRRLISMHTGLHQQMSGRLSGDVITLAEELEKAYRSSVHHPSDECF